MSSCLFQTIPEIIFEPIAAIALPGMIMAYWVFRKRHQELFWIITSAVVFMLAWRLSFHSVMISKRYASILIYPGIIFCVYFCFNLNKFLDVTSFGSTKFNKYIPAIFLVSLVGISLGKTLHFNPHNTYMQKVVAVYQADFQKEKSEVHIFINSNSESKRIQYYSGCKAIETLDEKTNICLTQSVVDELNKVKNIPGIYYFFLYLTKKHVPLSETKIEQATGGKWSELTREYTSSRMDKQLVLFRFDPSCPDIQEWETSIPSITSPRIKNGDFETPLSGKALRDKNNYFYEQGLESYANGHHPQPESWWIDIGKWNSLNPPIIYLRKDNPIAGNYSLYADSDKSKGNAVIVSPPIDTQSCALRFFCKGEGMGKSKVTVYLFTLRNDGSRNLIRNPRFFQIQSGKIYQGYYKIDKNDFAGEKYFFIMFIINGAVSFDNVEILPLSPHPSR